MTTKPRERSEGLRLAIEAAGNVSRLALLCGVSRAAACAWTRIPDDRIIQIEMVTGVPREKLRPELFRRVQG
jgi:hypothetical protein